ncbi:MAG: phosphonate ABC transporter, permease protein PhnE [Chloroflexota bacterium]|nr:phosphonate ABC transporter, permease protein PhnE [Chloroflexota bacterium]
MERVETKRSIKLLPKARTLSGDEFREQLLKPWPHIGVGTIVAAILIVTIYSWGINGTNARPDELVEGIPNIINFIVRLFPPQLKTMPYSLQVPNVNIALPVPEVIFAIIETVQMAIIGTTLAIFLSIPFGLLAARNTAPHPTVYQITRLIMNVNRAIPDIIFALVFVAAVGLGPFGGVLALAVGSIGFMGKLYAESIEAIDPQQVLAVRATGANRLQTFLYGVVPQALPLIASYSLLLFESNVRSATILGLVGAGGVGFTIHKYLSLFQYRYLTGALILITITVTVVDRVSDRLRKKIT